MTCKWLSTLDLVDSKNVASKFTRDRRIPFFYIDKNKSQIETAPRALLSGRAKWTC